MDTANAVREIAASFQAAAVTSLVVLLVVPILVLVCMKLGGRR